MRARMGVGAYITYKGVWGGIGSRSHHPHEGIEAMGASDITYAGARRVGASHITCAGVRRGVAQVT